jgi:hypothetical protein
LVTSSFSKDIFRLEDFADYNLTFLDVVCSYFSILFFKRA